MKHKHTINCKKCGKEFEIECTDFAWNKGKYTKHCSRACSNSHIYSDEIKQKISEGVKKHNEKVKRIYEYVCDKCGKKFTSDIRLRKDRKKHCDNCKRKVVHYKEDFSSITDLSKSIFYTFKDWKEYYHPER